MPLCRTDGAGGIMFLHCLLSGPRHSPTGLHWLLVKNISAVVVVLCEQLCNRPRANYMQRQTDITSNMRTILVDWMIEVTDEYRMHRETLFLAVNFVDRFLSVMAVQRGKLQLVGTAAMFIAAYVSLYRFAKAVILKVSYWMYFVLQSWMEKIIFYAFVHSVYVARLPALALCFWVVSLLIY